MAAELAVLEAHEPREQEAASVIGHPCPAEAFVVVSLTEVTELRGGKVTGIMLFRSSGRPAAKIAAKRSWSLT